MNQNVYDNSKDALAHIMREYGAEVLLGKRLRNFFLDFAHVKESRKNVVFFVIESGAAEILKKNIGARTEEQEIAYRQAVERLIRKYPIERGEVESVMLEFTDALGWNINVQQQTPPKPQQTTPEPQTAPAPVQTPLSNLTPGQRNVRFGKYLWRVLDVQNNRALLLTEEILEKCCHYEEYTSTTWESCDLREYLNGTFLQTFSSQEQKRIAQTENRNADNPWYGTPGGRGTVDKVFLLSIDEVIKYFGGSGQLRERPTKNVWYINNEYSSARIAKYQGAKVWWWLRSPGFSNYFAAVVDFDGDLDVYGNFVDKELGGVRPALWLNLNCNQKPFPLFRHRRNQSNRR